MKVHLRAAMIVLSASLASGCAAGGYSAAAAQRHLTSAGISPKAAACVVKRMGPRFGVDRLNTREHPDPDELKAELALLKACGATLTGSGPG